MSSVVKGIRDLLVAANVGVFNADSGWSIQLGKSPDQPDTVITIRTPTGGKAPNPAWLIDYPSVQVMVRGSENGWSAANDKAQEIKDTLLGLPSQDLNGDRWVQVNMIGDIQDLGFDTEERRPEFSLNFALIIQPGTNATTHRLPLP